MANDKLRVGVLFIDATQILDMAPVDLFGMMTPEYLTACKLPKPIIDQGIDVECLYISTTKDQTTTELTANAGLRVSHSIYSEECAPGKLDIVLVPGPDPKTIPSNDARKFLAGHAAISKTTILVICTGIFVAGYSGILDGKTVSGPRALIPELRTLFTKAMFDDSKRWCIDGNIWTSGGITNGLDMTAAFIKSRWPGPLSNVVCAMADVGDRSVDYDNNKFFMTGWWLFQILRAALIGKKKR